MPRLAFALIAIVLLAAGCLAGSKSTPSTAAGVKPTSTDTMAGMDMGQPVLMPFDLTATGCTWGGGHSIHTMSVGPLVVPPPWKVADVIEDIGVQPTYSDPGEQVNGVATTGWGNWHTDMICSAWDLNGAKKSITFGLILTRIEAPPFDPAPVKREYMVNVLASSDKDLDDLLMHAGWMAMPASGYIDWTTVPGTFHHLLDAGEHGVYESVFHTKAVDAMKDDTIRLWYQRDNHNKTWTPVSVDMHVTKKGTHSWADVEGYFSHTRTTDHEPLPGAYGQIAGLAYSDFDAHFTWGPQTTELLDKAYEHL